MPSKVGHHAPTSTPRGPTLVRAGPVPEGATLRTVKGGDTLSAIARDQGITLGQLREANPALFTPARRNGDLVHPGDQVVIPARQGWAARQQPARNAPQPPVSPEQLAAQAVQQQVAMQQVRSQLAPQAQPAPALPPQPQQAQAAARAVGQSSAAHVAQELPASSMPLPTISSILQPPNVQTARAQAGVEPAATTGVTWKAAGELPTGPLRGELRQGSVGDCYLVSALDSLLRSDPNALDRLIFKKDGVLFARFYEQHGFGPWQKVREVHVPISDKLPSVGDRKPYLDAGSDPRPALIEKAFAKWKGGYEALQSGVRPEAAFEALTGRKSDRLMIGLTSDYAFRQLAQSSGAHKMMQANSITDERAAKLGLTLKGEKIVPNHAYGVVRAFEQGGRRYVELQNPWGHHERGSDGKDDGRFIMDYPSFERLFYSVQLERRD